MRFIPTLFTLVMGCSAKPDISTLAVQPSIGSRAERYDCLSGGRFYTVVFRSFYESKDGIVYSDLKMTDISSDGSVDLVSYSCDGTMVALDRRKGNDVSHFDEFFRASLKRAESLDCQDDVDYDNRKTGLFRNESSGWQEGEYHY